MEYDDLAEIMKVVDQESESENKYGGWSLIPEDCLVRIFKYLSVKDIVSCSECCKRWNYIGSDSMLWKYKFQRDFKIDKSIPRKPGESLITSSLLQLVLVAYQWQGNVKIRADQPQETYLIQESSNTLRHVDAT